MSRETVNHRHRNAAGEARNSIVLSKNSEIYVFIFDDDSEGELLRLVGNYAADPDLSFAWPDAIDVGRRAIKLITGQPPGDGP